MYQLCRHLSQLTMCLLCGKRRLIEKKNFSQ